MAQPVFHLASKLSPLGAGAGLLRVLPRLAGSGHEHHLVLLQRDRGAIESLRRQGITCHELDTRWHYDLLAAVRLSRLVRDAPLLHIWDEAAIGWALQPGFRSRPRKLLLTLSEPRPLPRGVVRRANRRQAHWIATSETTRTVAIDSELASDRGLLIPPGVILSPSPPSERDQVLAAWGLPSDAILIATCGELAHSRQLKELIWAADMVRVLHPRLRFVLVGDGPARRGLEYFARTAAIPENIVFAGDRAPASLLPHCRVYWEGSQWGDAAGMLLEALACGVPVVASDTPLHREWIREGIDGFLVGHSARADRTRATDQLIVDEALHGRMAEQGQERMAREHSLDAEVAALARLYAQLTSNEIRVR